MKVNDIKNIDFSAFPSKEASLLVYESQKHVPFSIKRVFTIIASEKCKRGFHAHKQATQLLICLQGKCVVTVDDGTSKKNIVLNQPNEGLLIPSTIWGEQAYEANTILMVLTDQPYDESDYIREYKDFLFFKKME